jgi:hypothetical protein
VLKECRTDLIKALNFSCTSVSINTSCHKVLLNKYLNSLTFLPQIAFLEFFDLLLCNF